MHRYDAIPSTSHKVLKAIWGKESMDIPASANLFDTTEAHMAEALFFNELDELEEKYNFFTQWCYHTGDIKNTPISQQQTAGKRSREDANSSKFLVKKNLVAPLTCRWKAGVSLVMVFGVYIYYG